jgi:nitrate reductase gamma subunit
VKLQFLFCVWPYVAAAALLLGCLVRSAVVRLRSRPNQRGLATAPQTSGVRGSRVAASAWLLLFAGHVLGIGFPATVLAWNASPYRLYALEGAGFAMGLFALAAWILVAGRSLRSTDRSVAADVGDSVFLGLVFVGVLSGILMAVAYRWASSWGVATLSPYLASLAKGAPRTESLGRLPFLVQLHVVSAFGSLAVFPATSYAGSALAWAFGARRAKRDVVVVAPVPQASGAFVPAAPESDPLAASLGQGAR